VEAGLVPQGRERGPAFACLLPPSLAGRLAGPAFACYPVPGIKKFGFSFAQHKAMIHCHWRDMSACVEQQSAATQHSFMRRTLYLHAQSPHTLSLQRRSPLATGNVHDVDAVTRCPGNLVVRAHEPVPHDPPRIVGGHRRRRDRLGVA